MVEYKELGDRICIIGLSSTGKSTLAKYLGEKLDLKICHLDQLAHIPYTNWKTHEKELLKIDHDNFIKENNKWIIEGNYSFLMKDRFLNATSIIWLDFNIFSSVCRYIKRAFIKTDNRPGRLEGAVKDFSFRQIRYMIFKAPKNRKKYQKLIEQSNAKLVYINSFKKLKKYYQKWNLKLS